MGLLCQRGDLLLRQTRSWMEILLEKPGHHQTGHHQMRACCWMRCVGRRARVWSLGTDQLLAIRWPNRVRYPRESARQTLVRPIHCFPDSGMPWSQRIGIGLRSVSFRHAKSRRASSPSYRVGRSVLASDSRFVVALLPHLPVAAVPMIHRVVATILRPVC